MERSTMLLMGKSTISMGYFQYSYVIVYQRVSPNVFLCTLWLFNIAMGNSPFIEVYLLNMVIFHGYVR